MAEQRQEGHPDAYPDLVTGLCDPDLYSAPEPVAVRETHISWVFLAGTRAYKLKKPLRLPFLDYSTLERRKAMCLEEVRLNRRLAPTVYLGVRSVLREGNRLTLGSADDPHAIEFLVEMRRFEEQRTLACALRRGADARIADVAGLLARFHARAPVCRPPDLLENWRRTLRENVDTLASVSPDQADRLLAHHRFAAAYLQGRGHVLKERAVGGRVRDGHGDLRADHVLLEKAISIVDCVEFDPALRQIDVSADLAYLMVDLQAREATAEAQAFLNGYRAQGGDAGDDSLLAFFAAYRALVAAKVALLRGGEANAARAATLLELAERHTWYARRPLVIVVCGVSASGKSLLADRLGRLSGLPVLSSDRVRKGLVGLPATSEAPEQAYSAAMDSRTYSELGRRAAAAVRESGGAIVDATFHRMTQRDAFRIAYGDAGPPPLFLVCTARPEILRQRLRGRRDDPARTSDATEVVLERQLAAMEPFSPAVRALTISTDATPEAVVAEALARLDEHLSRARHDN